MKEELKPVPHTIKFDQLDLDFMHEYKEAHGVYLNTFVTEAVKEKIAKIKVNEEIKDLQRLK